MAKSIASLDRSLATAAKLLRLLREAGLPDEALQWPIDDQEMRLRLVNYWRNNGYLPSVYNRIVNLDDAPFIPNDDWEVRDSDQFLSQAYGRFEWDPAKVDLFVSSRQKENYSIKGSVLRQELEDRVVFSASLLDWLIGNQDQIPVEYRGKLIFFWGTIYQVKNEPWVRCLRWCGDRWNWHSRWLGSEWYSNSPALVMAG